MQRVWWSCPWIDSHSWETSSVRYMFCWMSRSCLWGLCQIRSYFSEWILLWITLRSDSVGHRSPPAAGKAQTCWTAPEIDGDSLSLSLPLPLSLSLIGMRMKTMKRMQMMKRMETERATWKRVWMRESCSSSRIAASSLPESLYASTWTSSSSTWPPSSSSWSWWQDLKQWPLLPCWLSLNVELETTVSF